MSLKLPIYLDYNATTPVDTRVLEEMLPYFTHKFGNAASKTHSFGWTAEDAVKTARQQIAKLLNCLEQEIIFTSGSTEAINLAIKGVYEAYHSKGNHIITVETEHKAVLDTCKYLEKKGAQVTYLPVDKNGLINLEQLNNSITDKTILVCIMYANNETGVIQPIKEISKIVHAKNSILFSDATQAIGKINVDIQKDGIDLLCMSAHKIYGPKGVGALYIRRKYPRVTLISQMHGGGHERGLRSGTLNVPGIVGLGKSLSPTLSQGEGENLAMLRDLLEKELCKLPNAKINGKNAPRLPNTSNILFKGVKADSLITKLKDIAFAAGSACTSANPQPSHVLKAMGLSDADAFSSVRFSLGKYTTMEEIEFVIKKITENISL